MPTPDDLPLSGVRVIDVSSVVMGPLATQILADLGADVIVVERHDGDANRHMGVGPHPELSGPALNLMRNKRSIVLDIRSNDGRKILLDLVRSADVFVTNLRPAARARAGLTYHELTAVRPDLVYCAAAGYPPHDPRADDAAYDDIIQSATGYVDVHRRAGMEARLAPTIVVDKVAGMAIANARAEYETALDTENRLARAFDGQKKLADQMSEAGIHYNILKREAETNKELYDGLLQRMKEAGVAAGLKSSNIRIVDRAETPKLPHAPNIPRTLALALLLGGMGGVGLAFFLDYLDNSLKTPEEIEERVGLPSLGLIPSLQSARGGYGRLRKGRRSEALAAQGVELAALTAGSSLIAEAYRGVRTALLLSTPGTPPKIIMVTSSKAGEGKMTTTCNIALSLAQTGKKVLVVDCDMRRPRIHKIFNTQGSSGLSEYLTGQVDLVDVVEESQVPGLFVVHAGTTPPNPGELLGSQRMQDALEGAADTFDFIFLDTPPLMSVTDPLIVAPLSDGVILVSKGGENPPEILRRARKNLEMVHARILGVVCNSVDLRATAYSHYYHQYYDYHSYVNDNPSAKAS